MNFKSNFDNDAYKSLGFLFIRVYNTWHYQIHNILKKQKLTHSQFVVLTTLGYLLQENDVVTQVRIAKFVNMDTMTLSKIVKKLVEIGYVGREKSLQDPRANSIFLTETGVSSMNEAIKQVEQIDEEFFGKLTVKKQNELMKLLEILGASDE